MDFHYKKSGTIYNLHSFWTKQPIDPIIFFIKKFTKTKDKVLDPFSGTGMTGVAALLADRKAILNDISPISLHIAEGYCTNFHFTKNEEAINLINDRITKRLDHLYKTNCGHCKQDADIKFTIVAEVYQKNNTEIIPGKKILLDQKYKREENAVFKEFRPIIICYKCSCSKLKQKKKPDKRDIKNWNNNAYKKLFYPKDDFFGNEPKRNYKKGIKKVYQLYSPINLSALAILYDEINKIANKNLKQLYLFTFTSILFNSSLLSRYRSYENTSIKMGTYYIAPLIKDTNVVSNFFNKLRIIEKGNNEIFKDQDNTVTFYKDNADRLKSIKSNSIDYIYTDPPYSDVISYSELNLVYEAWLSGKTKLEDELVVNKFQNKTIDYYAGRFKKFLLESNRVLKKGKHLTLVFHHPKIEHWRHIQIALINTGFEPIITKTPTRLISNSKTSSQHQTNKNSQCFLVFNFRKSDKRFKNKLVTLSDEDYNKLVKATVTEAKKEGYTSNSDIYDYVINKLLFKVELVNNITF